MIPKKPVKRKKKVSKAPVKLAPKKIRKKKKKRMNAEHLCIQYAEAKGWLIGIVERWIPYARIRKDLFGFIDLVAIDPEFNVYGIQTTSQSNVNARINKIKTHQNYDRVRHSSMKIEVWGWKKKIVKGEEEFTLSITKL